MGTVTFAVPPPPSPSAIYYYLKSRWSNGHGVSAAATPPDGDSAPLVYFTPVATYVISILFLLPIKTIPEPSAEEPTGGLVAEIVDTFNYIRPMRELFWSARLKKPSL